MTQIEPQGILDPHVVLIVTGATRTKRTTIRKRVLNAEGCLSLDLKTGKPCASPATGLSTMAGIGAEGAEGVGEDADEETPLIAETVAGTGTDITQTSLGSECR